MPVDTPRNPAGSKEVLDKMRPGFFGLAERRNDLPARALRATEPRLDAVHQGMAGLVSIPRCRIPPSVMHLIVG